MVNEITIRKGSVSTFSESGTVRIRLNAILREPTNILIVAPVTMRVSDQNGARLLKQTTQKLRIIRYIYSPPHHS